MGEGKRKIILLVEDESLIAMAEKRQLEMEGYEVLLAPSGEKAVELAVGAMVALDLILMDIDLGNGMDGAEAAERILSAVKVPIVFLSSHREPEIVEKTERITSYGYVVKNSGPIVLNTSIKMAFKLFDAHKRITEKESDYRLLFENTLNAIEIDQIILDAEGRPIDYEFLEVNSAFELSTGLKASEVVNRRATEILPGIKKTDLLRIFGQVALTGESVSFETYYSPTKRYRKISAFRVGLGRFSVAFEDITERRRAEEKLRENMIKLDSAQEVAKIGFWSMDLETGKIEWSKGLKTIFELDLASANPSLEEFMGYVAESDRAFVYEQSRLQMVPASQSVFSYEYRIVTKKGSLKTLEHLGRQSYDEEGALIGLYGSIQDITERKNSEARIQSLLEAKGLI